MPEIAAFYCSRSLRISDGSDGLFDRCQYYVRVHVLFSDGSPAVDTQCAVCCGWSLRAWALQLCLC